MVGSSKSNVVVVVIAAADALPTSIFIVVDA
jgi:hypothetical protein